MAKRARARKPTASKTVRRNDRRDQRPKGKAARRDDGFYNEYSGHGTERDRRSFTRHQTFFVTEQEAISMWRGDDIMARIIEMLPREAVRRGIALKIGDKDGKALAELLMAEVERLDMLEKIKVAGQWERAYGGAAIFPVLEGAVGDLSEPLDEATMRGITRVAALHLLEPRELRPSSWYTDITHPKFRQPEKYRLWPLSGGAGVAVDTQEIHESRLVIFPGIRVSNQFQNGQRPGWGDSVIMRVREVVADFGLAWGSAATLLHEFATGVLKLDGLDELLVQTGGETVVQKKLAIIDMMKSTLKARVIGGKDDFKRESTPVSGMEGMLMQLAQRLAAAADMPVTRLMGMSPAGMNATGESDDRAWYDRVEGVRSYYRKMVEMLLLLVIMQAEGPAGGVEPETWSMEWIPLWQPSDTEEAQRRKTVADTDNVYFQMGMPAQKIFKARFGGDTFSPDLQLDPADLEAQDELAANPEDLSDEDLEAMGYVKKPADGETPEDEAPPARELLELVMAVVDGEIPRDAAIKILEVAYGIDAATADDILGDEDFEPTPAVNPFAPPGGKPGGPPGGPPGAPEEPGAQEGAEPGKAPPGAPEEAPEPEDEEPPPELDEDDEEA